MRLTSVVLLWGSLSSACIGATREQLTRRAAFDLDCPEGEISVVELDKNTRGVKGCGQRATYVEQCKYYNGNPTDCTWVLNTDARRDQGPRAD